MLGSNSYACATVLYSLDSIFDLEVATVGGED